ncbi:MAG: peptidase [Gemmatimonadetes bacterium]|nr:peptidase [Gemmatimonadota bacterium]
MIIDLRNSRGGSAALANFLISHFAPADTQHSLTVYDRVRNSSFERYTMASVPGPRRPDVPLFVLVDDVTRSAAEDVPFVLQNMKRATIVGSNTAGAGRNNTFVTVGEGFTASISFTRVMDPVTHREWERTGITPDIRIPPDSALPEAHALALEAVAARSTNAARQRELGLVAEAVREAGRQRALPSRAGSDYVGTYEGGQYVTVEDGHLTYQSRVAQPRVWLVSMRDGSFGAGSARYRFAGTGARATLQIVTADGRATTYPRVSATVPVRRM